MPLWECGDGHTGLSPWIIKAKPLENTEEEEEGAHPSKGPTAETFQTKSAFP